MGKRVKSISIERERVKVRFIDGIIYVSDNTPYQSNDEAKAVIFLVQKTDKNAKGVVIKKDHKDFLYWDKITYDKMKIGILKIPYGKEIENFLNSKEEKKKKKNTVKEIHSNYMYGRKEKYQVIKLADNVSPIELIDKKSKTKKLHIDKEIEIEIDTTLEHISKNFSNLCPKCASKMHPHFIVIQEGRIPVHKCKICNFYLPRYITI